MEMTFRDIAFRQPDGSVVIRSVPTYTVPDSFYDKEYADALQKQNPAMYLEYMREVDEAFIATYFPG